MAKSIRGTQKKRGRPKTTGRGTQIGMRWHELLLGMIDAWAAKQDDKPPRSEAIRRLVERGLMAARTDAQVELRATALKRALSSHPAKPRRPARQKSE
jgi:hypothetical protein